jgi:hypothetical protein
MLRRCSSSGVLSWGVTGMTPRQCITRRGLLIHSPDTLRSEYSAVVPRQLLKGRSYEDLERAAYISL